MISLLLCKPCLGLWSLWAPRKALNPLLPCLHSIIRMLVLISILMIEWRQSSRGPRLSCSPTVLPKDAMFSGRNLPKKKNTATVSADESVKLNMWQSKRNLLSNAELSWIPSGPRSTTLTKIWSRSITWLFSRLTGKSLRKQQQT